MLKFHSSEKQSKVSMPPRDQYGQIKILTNLSRFKDIYEVMYFAN